MKISIFVPLSFLLVLTAFVLPGCALYSAPKKVSVKIPLRLKYTPSKNKNIAYRLPSSGNKWWKNFGSKELDALVNESLKNNLEYRMAVRNVQIAKTYVTQNESGLFPSINLTFSTTRNKLSGYETSIFSSGSSKSSIIYNLNQAGLTASYEIDLWHRIANSVNEAGANVSASKEEAEVVKLTLLSNVVNSYFQICYLNSEIKNLEEQYIGQKEIFRLNNILFKDGIEDEGAVLQAKESLEIMKTFINSSIRLREISKNTLAYYIGEYPEDLKINFHCRGIKSGMFKNLVPSGISSKMLIKRPDVKEAGYSVISFSYAKKESLANFFPVFSLTGNYGYASTSLVNFISNANSVWNFGLDILAPIFNYKQNISIYERSKLQYKNAVLNYRNTVVNAFKETDDSLITYMKDYDTLNKYRNTYLYAKRIYGMDEERYKDGIESRISFLSSRLNYLSSRYNLMVQKQILISDVIGVYNALGMGL